MNPFSKLGDDGNVINRTVPEHAVLDCNTEELISIWRTLHYQGYGEWKSPYIDGSIDNEDRNAIACRLAEHLTYVIDNYYRR